MEDVNLDGYIRSACCAPKGDVVLSDSNSSYAELITVLDDASYKSRLTQSCEFDIVRRKGSFSSMETVTSPKDTKVFSFSRERTLFENQEPRFELDGINFDRVSVSVYLLPNGKQEISFIPMCSGVYTFDYPSQTELSLNGVVGNSFYLEKDVRHILRIYNISSQIVIGVVNCNIPHLTPSSNVTVKGNSSQVIKYIPQTSEYKHLQFTNSFINIELLNENFRKITVAENGDIFYYFNQDQTYYLYIKNSSNENNTVVLNEISIQNITVVENYKVSANDKIMCFNNPYESAKTFTVVLDSNKEDRFAAVYNLYNEEIGATIINGKTKIIQFQLAANGKCYIVFSHNDYSINVSASIDSVQLVWLIDGKPKYDRVDILKRHDEEEKPNGYKIELFIVDNDQFKNKVNVNFEIYSKSVNYLFDGQYLKVPYTSVIGDDIYIRPLGYDGCRLTITIARGRQDIEYKIVFNQDGGTNGTTSVNVRYKGAMPLAFAPEKLGCEFLGYYTEREGNGIRYYDGNMVPDFETFLREENFTLFAYWVNVKYKITFHSMGEYEDIISSAYAIYGKDMPTYPYRLNKTGYAFDGFYDINGVKYYDMRVLNDEEGAMINGTEVYLQEFAVSHKKWDKLEPIELYAKYTLLQCNYVYTHNCPQCGVLETSAISLAHGSTYSLSVKSFVGHNFDHWDFITSESPYTGVNYEAKLVRSTYDGKIYPKYRFFAVYNEDSCIAQGTLITLADGTQVPVESLKGDEMLLVWNMLTGQNEAAKILFIDKDPAQVYKVINLGFSDGTVVKVISEHGFWNYNLNKYVYLDSTASQYIGHYFNKGNTRVRLTSVDIRDEYTVAYSPVTYKHLCYYVNGMLSMPGGIDGLFNIFEVNADTMTYDIAAMQRDIATYGLFTYEEFAELVPVTKDVFDAFNGQYFKVAIGKGLITVEQLANLANRYSEFFV